MLIDVVGGVWIPGHANFRASLALIGTALDDIATNPAFSEVKVQITGIDRMSGVVPLKSFRFPSSDAEHLDGEWVAEGNPGSSLEWLTDARSMYFEYDGSARIGDPYSYSLAFSPVIRMSAADALPIRVWIEDWVLPLRRITTLATGNPEQVTYLDVTLESHADTETRRSARCMDRLYKRCRTRPEGRGPGTRRHLLWTGMQFHS